MTLQLARTDDGPRIDDSPEVRWASPAAGLWVASRRGEHAGMVERVDGVYHARSARGRALGSFDDLDSAFTAIDGKTDEPSGARNVTTLLVLLHGGAVLTALALALLLVR